MNILVTGGTGMVGHALKVLIPDAKFVDSTQYDLRSQLDANYLFLETGLNEDPSN